MRIYVYYWGHCGDALTTRPMVKLLKRLGHKVTVLCYYNHEYLFNDLEVEAGSHGFNDSSSHDFESIKLMVEWDAKRVGAIAVSCWCGTYPDLDEKYGHNWWNVVLTVERQLAITLRGPDDSVPMLDFDAQPFAWEKQPPRCVYLENGPTRSGHCKYEFDVEDLHFRFPAHTFCCTAKPPRPYNNVYDFSDLDLIQLQKLSEACCAIVGKGSGPFLTTYTEANRSKPRAVMGYETLAPFKGPFWTYPGDRTQHLKGTEELHAFLEALT